MFFGKGLRIGRFNGVNISIDYSWFLIFGLFVSTAFTLLVIPAVYMLIFGKPQPAAVPAEEEKI